MSTIVIILGVLCLLYYLLMLVVSMDFSIIWLLAGVVLAGGGILLKYRKAHDLHLPGALKLAGGLILAACLLVFIVTESLIISGMFEKGESDLDYVIVLGAQVRGDVPSKALTRRIQKAEEYLKANPQTIAILSGGQGKGENISEAKVMYDCLAEAGIPKERLLMEDKSTTTMENLKFSAKLIGAKTDKIGLISQNFHIYRAVSLARHQGYTEVCGIAAPSELIYQPHYMVREAFALVKEKLVGNL